MAYQSRPPDATLRLAWIRASSKYLLEGQRVNVRLLNKRRHHRANIGMRVFMDSAVGVTRDMSASGVYFWISGAYKVGESITFWIELKRSRDKMMRKCKGKILRVERQDATHVGLAVRITESTLLPFKTYADALHELLACSAEGG